MTFAVHECVRASVPIHLDGYAQPCGIGYCYTVSAVNDDGTVQVYRDECAGVKHYATVPAEVLKPRYVVYEGIHYDAEIPFALRCVLHVLKKNRTLVRLHHGYVETDRRMEGTDKEIGEDWLEEFDCCGRLGNSMGPRKVLLLVPPKDAENDGLGGGEVCTGIVKVSDYATNYTFWEHPKYHLPHVLLERIPQEHKYYAEGYRFSFLVKGEVHANFKTEREVKAYLKKLGLPHAASNLPKQPA